MNDTAELRFGPFSLVSRNGPLLRGSTTIHLQPKALAVLWTLARQHGEVVTKTDLLNAVWPGADIGDEALTFQIKALRRVIEDDPKEPRFLLTAHRIGFRLAAPVESDTPPAGAGAPFVGREAELDRLRASVRTASNGRRQLLFVTGEAGIGKTRLLDELLTRLKREQPDLRVGRGQAQQQLGTGEPFQPMLEALGQLVRESPDEVPLDVLRHLAPSWLLQLPNLLEAADYANLRRQTVGISRERMLREMAEALEQLSAKQPLILILEDLHWSDTSTLDLIAAIGRRREPARLLVLCTCRPTDAIVSGHPVRRVQLDLKANGQASELALGYLPLDPVHQYLQLRLGTQRASADFSAAVYSRSSGHPLFLTQIAQYLDLHGQDLPAQDLETLLPQELHNLIELQLAQLPLSDQLMLEVASVAGPEFAAAAVAAGSGVPVDSIEQHCERLVQQGLFLEEQGLAIWPDGTVSGRFRFRHALYVQVLRRRLAASRNARLHRLLGERLEAAYGERSSEIAAELVYHYEFAGITAKALHYCVVTARTALQRVAFDEIMQLTARGLRLLESLPAAAAQHHAEELALRVIAATTLQARQGYGSVAAHTHLDRVKVLLPHISDPALLEAALGALWLSHHFRSDFEGALTHADQIRALGRTLQRPILECCGSAWASLSLHPMGRHVESVEQSERAIAMARAAIEQAPGVTALEPGCAALASSGITQWFLGFPDLALRRGLEARRDVERIGNPYALCINYSASLLSIRLFRREWTETLEACDIAIVLSEKYDHLEGLAWAKRIRAVALSQLDHTQLPHLREQLELQYRSGQFLGLPAYLTHEAESLLALDRPEEAGRSIETTFEIIHGRGVRAWEPEALRVDGLRLQALGRSADAEARFHEALSLSRSRRTRSLELRAALSLARLWSAQSSKDQAIDLVASTYAAFTEGFDTPDLTEARRFLDRDTST